MYNAALFIVCMIAVSFPFSMASTMAGKVWAAYPVHNPGAVNENKKMRRYATIGCYDFFDN